jgi:hypothetical protein
VNNGDQANLANKYILLVGFGHACTPVLGRSHPCAARTHLFELIATPNGALRASNAHRSFAASYSTLKNI